MFLLRLRHDHYKAGYVAPPISSYLASDGVASDADWPKLALAGKQGDVTGVFAVCRCLNLRFNLHAAVDTSDEQQARRNRLTQLESLVS